MCDCSNSPFTDSKHGHIVTGNLNIVSNHKLQVLLSKGPSFREANKIDWGKVFLCIKRGVVDCAKSWCDKQKMDVRVLTEWKSRLLMEVKCKIQVLKKRHYRRSNKILDDDEVKTFLTDFHQKFVITPTDKAGNNFSIVCKNFYICGYRLATSLSRARFLPAICALAGNSGVAAADRPCDRCYLALVTRGVWTLPEVALKFFG